MRGRTGSRALAGAALALLAVIAAPASAFADPPGPTDFESTVVAVEPPADGFTATIIAGDAFFALAVEPGVRVTVAGYQGEPYLEFEPSGEVRENRNSPTYFMNRTKGGDDVPAGVNADTAPNWVVVATDGNYAWHDHRTHWMGGTPQGERGAIVARGTVPILLDEAPVDVRVDTRWLAPASPAPAIAGAALGGVVAVGYVLARRRAGIAADVALAVAAVLALVVGFVQFRSVPGVTGPSPFGWVLPGTALVAAVAGAVAARRPAWSLLALGAHALAGIELAIWAVGRRAGLLAAILPTDGPYWLDRGATTAVGVVGGAAAGLAVVRLVELVTRPVAASATGRPPIRT